MKPTILLLSVLTPVVLSACLVPPSMMERASFGPPPEYWQSQGRYRQMPADGRDPQVAEAPRPAPSGAQSVATDPARENLPVNSAGGARPQADAAPLYAWDGGVVAGAPQGAVTENDGAPRGLESPPAGRMHIIELYQQVLDERDALASEVELLRRNLEQTGQALEAKSKDADELTTKVASLEASQKALLEDNHSLAARLVTAQIRRLEAEKLLLETRIQIEQARAEEAGQATQALSRESVGKKGGGAKPRKPEAEEAGGGRP